MVIFHGYVSSPEGNCDMFLQFTPLQLTLLRPCYDPAATLQGYGGVVQEGQGIENAGGAESNENPACCSWGGVNGNNFGKNNGII